MSNAHIQLTGQSIRNSDNRIHQAMLLLQMSIGQNDPGLEKSNIPKYKYIREYRTLGLTAPRQSGKTEWIIRNSRINDLIIVCTENHKTDVKTRLEKYSKENPELRKQIPDTMIWSEIIEGHFRPYLEGQFHKSPPLFKRVFVDDASYVFKKIKQKKLFEEIEKNCPDDVVFYHIG